MYNDIKRRRQFTVFFLFCFSFLLVALRLYDIQIKNYSILKSRAENQHNISIRLEPKRGIIYDNINRILALNINIKSVYAISKDIKNKGKIALRLSSILGLEKDLLTERLNRDKSFVWIKRKISDKEAEVLEKAHLGGIGFIEEAKRFYPNDSLGCQLIGFTDIDNIGLEGIELYYDSYLKGKYGWENILRDAKRAFIYSYGESLPPADGYGLALTIDEVIQHIAEKEITDIARKSRPKAIMVIAMDPYTGEILAMANYPNYNLNNYQNVDKNSFKNRCVTDVFEPGSVFKIVTASAAIEEGAVNFEDKFYCEKGFYKIGNRVLHDYRPYDTLSFKEVIEKSSNIGTVKVAAKLGRDKLYGYIEKFGFGARSGIDLAGEENGILRPLNSWSKVDMTTVPMGQGISCTALQLVNAVSVVANGGMLMKPYIVKRIIGKEGSAVKVFTPESIRRVISEEASYKMKHLLRGVVKNGTGKKADMDDYEACGKTGTAEKVDDNGVYSKDRYVASFVGFAPFDKPRVALVICVDEPKGEHFGGQIAAPAFKNIMQKILKYLEVPEDKRNAV